MPVNTQRSGGPLPGQPMSWRRVDQVAIWSQIVAVAAGAVWFVVNRKSVDPGQLPFLQLIVLVSLLGLGAGIGSLITRKRGQRWWPALVAILVGAVLVGFTLFLIAFIASHLYI